MTCKTCGLNDHHRASSKKCPFYAPRQSKIAPEEDTYKTDEHVYKIGFKSVVRPRFRSYILPLINSIVRNHSQIAFEASHLLDLHVTLLLENGNNIPDIFNETYVRQFFRIVQNSSRGNIDEDVKNTYNEYMSYRASSLQKPVHCTQVITYLVKEYCVNIKVHIPKIIDILYNQFLKRMFLSKWHMKKEEAVKLIKSIMNTDDQEEFINAHPHLVPYITQYTELHSNVTLALNWIYQQNILNVKNGRRVYPLLPTYDISAKYITLDTDCLYDLLHKHYKIKSTKKQFGEKQVKWFKYFFKIPKRHMNTDTKIDKDKYKTVFNFYIKTDGVGASIGLARWKKKDPELLAARDDKERKELYKQKMEKLREEKRQALALILQSDKSVCIGVDPGKTSVMTSIVEGTRKSKQWSNRQYYTESKFKVRRQKANRLIKEKKLDDYNSNVPRYKSGIYSCFKVNYLRYMLTESFEKMFDLKCTQKYCHLRWSSYIHNQKTVRKFCEEMVQGYKMENVIICFGDASYKHNLKGTPTSPKQTRFKKCLRLMGYNVFETPEYNSSQVCSNCMTPVKMKAGCKSSKVIERHFVRSCQLRTCSTIWNRDVNAARNMIQIGKSLILEGMKPEVYSMRLPEEFPE